MSQETAKAAVRAAAMLQTIGKVRHRSTGVCAKRADLGVAHLQLLMQGISEDRVGQLGLEVAMIASSTHQLDGIPAQIATIFPEVLFLQAFVHGVKAAKAGMVHNPSVSSLLCLRLQQWEKLCCEQEMRQVVGLHLGVIAILRGCSQPDLNRELKSGFKEKIV